MDLVELARVEAFKESALFGTPHRTHIALSYEKGLELARKLGADVEIVALGTLFMDLKLGEAIKQGKQAEHAAICAKRADELLKEWGVPASRRGATIACIEQHHNIGGFTSKEAEICANADCYRFLHPTGIMAGLTLFGRRFDEFPKVLDAVDVKMDEKHKILSLPVCKEELEPHYKEFKAWIAQARKF